VPVTPTDFQAQFRLARQVEQARVRVRQMLEQASELKVKLHGQAVLSQQLAALTGEDSPVGGANAPTTLTAISERLDSLAEAIDGADAAPTPDNSRGFAIVLAALDSIEPRWKAFTASVPR
jgi:hypothetical protein